MVKVTTLVRYLWEGRTLNFCRGGRMFADIIGPDGLIIVLVLVVFLLFGGKSLPKLARGLGSAQHEFLKGLEKGESDDNSAAAPDGTIRETGDAAKH
jgi:sec-independent protein translocase protein TatA